MTTSKTHKAYHTPQSNMNVAIKISIGISIALALIFISTFIDSPDTPIHCKNDEGGILFSYDLLFNTVDINGYPTYKSGDTWVDFIDVEDEGFMVISSQKTYDARINDLRIKKHVYHYQKGKGFTLWHDVPHEETDRIKSRNTLPAQKPAAVFTDCKNQPGGSIIQLLMAINRA